MSPAQIMLQNSRLARLILDASRDYGASGVAKIVGQVPVGQLPAVINSLAALVRSTENCAKCNPETVRLPDVWTPEMVRREHSRYSYHGHRDLLAVAGERMYQRARKRVQRGTTPSSDGSVCKPLTNDHQPERRTA